MQHLIIYCGEEKLCMFGLSEVIHWADQFEETR